MPKKRFSSEQIIAKLRQIEVQLAQGKSIALACKDAAISEQKLRDECLKLEIFYGLKEAQVIIGAWRDHYNRVRPHSSLTRWWWGWQVFSMSSASGTCSHGPT